MDGCFAAPGAVKITDENIPSSIKGRISVEGPMANMSLALIFIVISSFVYPLISYSSIFDLIYMISTVGFSVNSYLAAFNLFPLYTLDGLNVIKWNKKVWAVTLFISVTMMLLSIFIGAESMVTFLVGLVR